MALRLQPVAESYCKLTHNNVNRAWLLGVGIQQDARPCFDLDSGSILCQLLLSSHPLCSDDPITKHSPKYGTF